MRRTKKKVSASFFLLIVFAGLSLLFIYTIDHYRAPTLPNTVPICEDAACGGDFREIVQQYEDRLDPPPGSPWLLVWASTDFCAASLQILSSTSGSDPARWIPESLDRRGVLSISSLEDGFAVSRGPAISDFASTLIENFKTGGTRSCYMSDYGLLFTIWWSLVITSGLGFLLLSRSKG